jgi:hypothetical protein
MFKILHRIIRWMKAQSFSRDDLFSFRRQFLLKVSKDEDETLQVYFFFIFFYSYVHTMFGSFLPPSPHPLLAHTLSLSPTPSLPGRNYFALISNFVEERV